MGLSEKYSTSLANLALKGIPAIDNQADYVPPGRAPLRYEVRRGREEAMRRGDVFLNPPNTMDPLGELESWWTGLTPEEKVAEVFGNLLPGPKGEVAALGAVAGLTRSETIGKLRAGLLKFGDLVGIERLTKHVENLIKGVEKTPDERLAPLSDIFFDPQMATRGGRTMEESELALAYGEWGRKADPTSRKIAINPFKESKLTGEHTFLEEISHINQYEDTDLMKLFSRGQNYLRKRKGLLGEDAYDFDPFELHAKYQATKTRKYHEEMPNEFMRDVYDLGGIEHVARKWVELGERYPGLKKETDKFAVGVRSYLSELNKP